MVQKNYPHLCGGIFFVLLLQARKPRQKVRESHYRKNDGLADTDILKSLIRIANPEYMEPAESTFSQNTSTYKACVKSIGTYLPFNNQEFISKFDNKVKNNYDIALSRMMEFTDTFLDASKINWLIKALLELINSDDTIEDTDRFYILKNGQSVKKSDIGSMPVIYVQPFLLGIWYFIIVKRSDNKIGNATFEQWHDKSESKGQQRSFISDIGTNFESNIKINLLDAEPVPEPEVNESYNETCEDCTKEAESAKVINNIINQPFFYNHNGDNNVHNYIITNGPQPANSGSISQDFNLDYYNLFVIGDELFDSKHFIVPRGKSLTESTAKEIKEAFFSMDDEAIAAIKSFPSIFASQNHYQDKQTDEDHMAYYGFVTDLRIQENGIKIYFKILNDIQQQRINENAASFGLDEAYAINELDRTHWAVKKINLIEAFKKAGIKVFAPV